MTSNILAGERRWASARRTGMTVLGKVAVPKPLNLPSQKLENHGMDPNVEIVPRGSIGWGSRNSSSASNPWGSSSVSSTAEGYGSSPGHPSGRPSSSGSRPSTAGSEITHDHGGNAWGLNSRPSSASGISASNQTSLTSSRPHSADTRPASSQISRFAEQHADSVAAHHPVVSSERGGLASSSDKERFSLSSGDFPTLNAVADSSLKSSGSSGSRDQGSHSRPTSASGEVAKKENSDISQPDNVDNGTVNAWKREGHRNSDEMHPSMDKWHGEPPHYHNPNVPHPQFDGWRGPSMNHPGVWYQGLPRGPPPYGPPVGPGGFPVEPPYSFYCPRVPPPSGLPNAQQVPLNRPGPMVHPQNGEMYRPPMADAFVRPGMQFRPGFYHSPPMPFEGYYGPPPMGYCNPNEHEVPFNSMPHGPPAYNRYPTHDNDPAFNDSTATHNRTGIKRFSEKAEPNNFHDVPEHHVILKHNDDVNQGGHRGENIARQNYPISNKRSQPGISSRTKEWGAEDCDNEDDMYSSSPHDFHVSSGPTDARGGSESITIRSGPYGSGDNVAMSNIQSKKLEAAAPPLAGDGILPSSAILRGPTLIQKIDGLNEKVRTSDFRIESQHQSHWVGQKGRNEGPHPPQWGGEQKVRNEGSHPSQWGELKSRNEGPHPSQWGEQRGRNEGSHPSQWAEQRGRNDGSHPSQWPADLSHSSQRPDQKGRNEVSHPFQWAEQKGGGAIIGEILVPLGDKTSHVTTAAPRRGYGVVRGKTGDFNKQKFNGPGDGDGWQKQPAASVQSPDISTASDVHENRTNSTSVAAEVLPEKQELDNEVGDAPDSQAQRLKMREMVKQRALQLQKEEEERTREQKAKALAKLEELNRRKLMNQKDEKVGPEVHSESGRIGEWGEEEKPADSDNNLPFETRKTALLDTPPTLPLKEEPVIDGDRDFVVPHQLNDASNKQAGYKQKQSGSRKNFVTKAHNNNTELVDGEISSSVAPGDVGSGSDSKTSEVIHIAVESSSQRRKSSNRNTKNKHNKSDDLPPASTFTSTAVDESKLPQAVSVQVDTNGDGAQGSVNHHQKPQKFGRSARNQPTARFSDKYHGNDHVVWAPVQPQNKTEPAAETGRKAVVEESVISAKNDDQMQNINMKSKRAEMERYVPKPVAKELAQQSTVNQSDEVAEKGEPEFKSTVAENVSRVAESRVEDSKHNKQSKGVGGWRQRGPSSFKPNPVNQQSVEPDLSNTQTEEQQSGFKDQNASDDAKKVQYDSSAGIISHQPQGRFPENTGRAKRHALKGERGMRNDREQGSQKLDRSHIQQQEPKMNLAVKSSSTKENRGSEDRPSSSLWQPKSSSISNIVGGDSSTAAQNVATGSIKKGIQTLPEERHIKVIDSSRADPSVPKDNFPIEGTVSQHGQRREKKVPYSSKGHFQSHAPNEDDSTFGGSDESQAKQQQFSSDNRRGGRYPNARSFTNREFRGDLNHERQGQNIQHYEYQPIPGRNEKVTEDGSHNVGPRYKERGPQSRRGRGGQFHGRQNRSNVQVGAGYG